MPAPYAKAVTTPKAVHTRENSTVHPAKRLSMVCTDGTMWASSPTQIFPMKPLDNVQRIIDNRRPVGPRRAVAAGETRKKANPPVCKDRIVLRK